MNKFVKTLLTIFILDIALGVFCPTLFIIGIIAIAAALVIMIWDS